jgi:hypothetical protein
MNSSKVTARLNYFGNDLEIWRMNAREIERRLKDEMNGLID